MFTIANMHQNVHMQAHLHGFLSTTVKPTSLTYNRNVSLVWNSLGVPIRNHRRIQYLYMC